MLGVTKPAIAYDERSPPEMGCERCGVTCINGGGGGAFVEVLLLGDVPAYSESCGVLTR